MVSIADVAALAGVSPTTVSHALSGKRKVSETVKARVEAAMRELGYVPSRAAQSLASGRTHVLGLVVPDIANGFFADLAKGVESAAVERRYNVILCTTGFEHTRELLYLQMIRSRAVDGVIYAAGSPLSTSELTEALGDLPLVLVDEDVPGADATAFVSDNTSGGRLAAEYLLGLGHRRALVLAGGDDLESSRQRVDGFRASWTAGGGHAPAVAGGGFTEEGGRAAIAPYLPQLRDGSITAVFAANDLMALGAMDTLREGGLECPDDVSVMGFDDIGPARYTRPRLTTVRQDVVRLGSAAASALVAALEGEHVLDLERHILPVELVVRESTGHARVARQEGPR